MDTEIASNSLFTSATEAEALRRQQTAFCIFTLFVLAMLLLLHALFAFVLGEPSTAVLAVLGLSFAFRLGELAWLQSTTVPLSPRLAKADGLGSIVTLFLLAGLLILLTNHDHSPYQVLLAVPVLQAAFLFGLVETIITIVVADATIFLWLWRYFTLHPPASGAEYLEAGMLAVIFALMGLLVWLLVSHSRANQARLTDTLSDLQVTRARLADEEKLAAVGRLASGIAHEIRNPVAMIVSALSTATDPTTVKGERTEMYAIASRQAERLETLTNDFLTYAKPTVPRRAPILLGDLLSGVEDVTRLRASEQRIEVSFRLSEDPIVSVDASQMEGALLNLVFNAIEATPASGWLAITAAVEESVVRMEVENSGRAIAAEAIDKIFEPFFTTKAAGTGLGLAIARGVARAHGGDLWVSRNEDGHVTFTMTLPANTVDRAEMGGG